MNLEALTRELREADAAANERDWPAEAVQVLREAGCFANVVPERFGGRQAEPLQRLTLYESVARGSLTCALILTQHDAACELLADCDNEATAGSVLRRCAEGDLLLTVGISQLTTARQRGGPAMVAQCTGNGFVLNGFMPWVTSAPHADYVVTGGVIDTDHQILACLPFDAPGLTVEDPFQLMALTASRTARVSCENVPIGESELIRGPSANVLARRAPVKPLTVSFVALGMAGALIDRCADHADTFPEERDDLRDRAFAQYEQVRKELRHAARLREADNDAHVSSVTLRSCVNDLVIRLAATQMTLAKGSGFVAGKIAQRLLREAMFFLVWSAPTGVQAETIARLWQTGETPAGR